MKEINLKVATQNEDNLVEVLASEQKTFYIEMLVKLLEIYKNQKAGGIEL